MSAHFQRGLLLESQSRFAHAADEYRRHLADDPDDALGHTHLAICLVQAQKYEEATRHAQLATSLNPEDPSTFWALAAVMHLRGRQPEAMQAINQAISLNLELPFLYLLRAQLWMERKNWNEALQDAERGLEIEPDHVECLNVKAQALVQLNRRIEAGESLKWALAHDAENDRTHATLGWSLLEQGQSQQAMEHFREALRLNPDSNWARSGILEAMKSRNFIYRFFLAYLFAMSKLKNGAAWAIIIGAFVVVQFVGYLQDTYPNWSGPLSLVIVIYLAFALMTWLAFPLSNLVLLTSRFGRLALTPDHRRGALLLGIVLLLCIGALIVYVIFGGLHWQFAAIRAGLLTLPAAGIYLVRAGKPRRMMTIVTAVLALVGLGSLPLSDFKYDDQGELMVNQIFQTSNQLFTFGIIGTTFLVNVLAGTREKK